jgi:hypothetical protein
MRARTIGQIAALIAGHLGGASTSTETVSAVVQTEAASAVDLDAICDEDIERLIGLDADAAKRQPVEDATR